MTIRVGVFGAKGRMGQTVCEAVDADPDLEVVTRIDLGDRRDDMVDDGVQVAIDFTAAEVARDDMRWCAEHGIHAVIGTSGMTEADHDEARRLFTSSNCL